MSSTLPALLLRYSNSETKDTIQSHKIISLRNGGVWWGWWKKSFENHNLCKVFTTLEESLPSDVALVNRRSDEYHEARCEDIYYDSAFRETLSPDVSLTPDYYQEKSLFLWLYFTSFRKIDSNELNDKYGVIPKIERTLYLLASEDGGFEKLEPKKPPIEEIVEVDSDLILHLSDLHFGSDCVYPHGKGELPQTTQFNVLERICSFFDTYFDSDPGIVVISGDFVDSHEEDAFDFAKTFIDELLQAFNLNRNHLVIIPGNHDFELGDHDPYAYTHEHAYRDFISDLIGDGSQLERVKQFVMPCGLHPVFGELNSARIHNRDYRRYAWLGRPRFVPVLNQMSEAASDTEEPSTLIPVVHHHIVTTEARATIKPSSDDEDSMDEDSMMGLIRDAGDFIEKCTEDDIDIILHGHKHNPFVAKYLRASIFSNYWEFPCNVPIIIGAGSLTSSVRTPTFGNSFNIYELSNNEIRVVCTKFSRESTAIDTEFDIAYPLPLS